MALWSVKVLLVLYLNSKGFIETQGWNALEVISVAPSMYKNAFYFLGADTLCHREPLFFLWTSDTVVYLTDQVGKMRWYQIAEFLGTSFYFPPNLGC